MKRLLLAMICFAFSYPCLAQNADEPASKDDIILLLRTMHSHDMMRRTMEVQKQSVQQLFHDMVLKEKGKVPADFDAQFKKGMEAMIKDMPVEEIIQAMVPAYQNHFTRGDVEAMNAFYSSPVGQKVLAQLPDVMREGAQAAMPILTRYFSGWEQKMKTELEPAMTPPAKSGDDSTK